MLLKEIPEYLFNLHFLFLVCSSMFPHRISLQTLFHTTKFLATRLVTSIFITSRTQWYVKQYIKLKFTYISFPEHDPEIKHLMMLKCVFCVFLQDKAVQITRGKWEAIYIYKVTDYAM